MANTGQGPRVEHYLPRFSTQGIRDRPEAEGATAFCFARGQLGYKTSTRNIGGERNFYRIARGVDIEKRLTRDEDRYAPLLARLRLGVCRAEDQPVIAEFVNLLLARGRYLRTVMVTGMRKMIASAERTWREPDAAAALERRMYQDVLNRPEVRAAMRAVPPSRRGEAQAELRRIVSRSSAAGFAGVLGSMLDAEETVKSGQGDALVRFLDEPARGGVMGALSWSVQVTEASLILSDVGPVVRVPAQDRLAMILENLTEAEMILLPISPTILLLGVAGTGGTTPLDVEGVNRGIAAIAREFFVSSQNTERETEYATLIGTQPDPLDAVDFDDMARQSALRKE